MTLPIQSADGWASVQSLQAPEIQRQEEGHRARLLEEYPVERLYQLKRNCNACQEQDVSLLEGELVALLEDHDPLGSSSRWLVDTGSKYVCMCMLMVCVCVCETRQRWREGKRE